MKGLKVRAMELECTLQPVTLKLLKKDIWSERDSVRCPLQWYHCWEMLQGARPAGRGLSLSGWELLKCISKAAILEKDGLFMPFVSSKRKTIPRTLYSEGCEGLGFGKLLERGQQGLFFAIPCLPCPRSPRGSETRVLHWNLLWFPLSDSSPRGQINGRKPVELGCNTTIHQ